MRNVENLIYEMLTENTGSHMCDSGGAYGRHWEKNQKKTLQEFRDEKEQTITKEGDYYERCVSVFHYLSELELDDICKHFNFKNTNKKYFDDGRIVFNLVGKVEKRKRHEKTIRAWIKRFGGDKRYFLQCAVYNPFFKDQDNNAIINNICEGKKVFNVGFLGFMGKNAIYNDFLNSGDIILGMSGGEGWGLPEFHSVGLGKHAVVMDAHSYKGWANKDNSCLVNPSGKIEAYDGVFFNKGQPYNQGNIFDYNEDEFIAACEEAIKKVESNRVNEEGLKIQKEFTVDKTLDKILELV